MSTNFTSQVFHRVGTQRLHPRSQRPLQAKHQTHRHPSRFAASSHPPRRRAPCPLRLMSGKTNESLRCELALFPTNSECTAHRSQAQMCTPSPPMVTCPSCKFIAPTANLPGASATWRHMYVQTSTAPREQGRLAVRPRYCVCVACCVPFSTVGTVAAVSVTPRLLPNHIGNVEVMPQPAQKHKLSVRCTHPSEPFDVETLWGPAAATRVRVSSC